MNDKPLFGPVDRATGDKGFYNQMPDKLPGWDVLWEATNDIKPVLIVIDAATDAYVGDANAVPPVGAFLAKLRSEARQAPWRCGVMIVAHSNKQSRRGGQTAAKFDPFNPGQVAGSTAWTDKVRGVLAFMWDASQEEAGGGKNTNRVLSVPKANYGLSRVKCSPTAMHGPDGRVMGFFNKDVKDDWKTHLSQPVGRRSTANGAATEEEEGAVF